MKIENMGIDTKIETEREECVAELPDPRNLVNWLLSLAILDSTFCLQFVDPYGDTVFNSRQIPVLQSELSALTSRLTETNLLQSKQDYLERAAAWPERAIQEAHEYLETLSLGELQHHLEGLLSLLADVKIPHHYVRFVGD